MASADKTYATGKRKLAICRAWGHSGSGQIIVNGKSIESYFPRATHRAMITYPLEKKKGKAEGPSLITSSAPFTVLRIGSVAGPLFARISFAPWYENHESKGLLF